MFEIGDTVLVINSGFKTFNKTGTIIRFTKGHTWILYNADVCEVLIDGEKFLFIENDLIKLDKNIG